jgi:flagellar hook-associated protein 2
MATVTLGGIFSGINVNQLISQLDQANSVPITNIQNQQQTLNTQSSDIGFITTSLQSLQNSLLALNDSTLFKGKKATTSDSTVGAASVSSDASAGSLSLQITQLASASVLKSGGRASDNPAGTALAQDVFGTGALGTFTINNSQFTITSTTTLNDIVNDIKSVPGVDAATTQYDSTTGKFTIGSTGNIILGSSGDTSNFLQSAQLFNSNVAAGGPGYTVTSSSGVGRLDTTQQLGSITNFSGIPGSLSGPGNIVINGISVAYSTSDTLGDLLTNITNSSAGVVATYDSYSDQVILTNKNPGSTGITVADGSGQLAQALKLRTGTDTNVTLGNSTKFSVNGGPTRESTDATLDSTELGVAGLSFTATGTGTTTISIGADTSTIKTTIDAFVNQYNSTQNLINSYTKLDTTDPTKNGDLASDQNVTFLASDLRKSTTSQLNSSGTIQMLEDLGITGNGNDNTLTVSDSTKLQDALDNHLSEVISLFTGTNGTGGLYNSLNDTINGYVDSSTGTLPLEQQNISNQVTHMNDQIAQLQAQMKAYDDNLRSEFAQLDAFQAQTQGFSSFFGSNSSSSTSSTSSTTSGS